MSTQTTERDERWTYTGRRYAGGKLTGRWLDENGAELHFNAAKTKAAQRGIGSTFEVKTERDAAGEFVGAFVSSARFLESPDTDDARVLEWVALDRMAQTSDAARKRAERSKLDAAARFGELTLDELAVLLANAGPQRTALLANVLRHIGA